MTSLYERDFHAWAGEQAGLLRAGRLAEADLPHIIEEIESLGRGEKQELVDRLVALLVHLLEWRYQPGLRGNSWRLSIKEQRIRLAAHLDDNPSLKSKLDETIGQAYRLAVIVAERETGLPETTFPTSCPFAYFQMMEESFWPEGE